MAIRKHSHRMETIYHLVYQPARDSQPEILAASFSLVIGYIKWGFCPYVVIETDFDEYSTFTPC